MLPGRLIQGRHPHYYETRLVLAVCTR